MKYTKTIMLNIFVAFTSDFQNDLRFFWDALFFDVLGIALACLKATEGILTYKINKSIGSRL